MNNLLYTLKGLASRYETFRIRIPSMLVNIMIKRDMLKLRRKIEQTHDEKFINFTSVQGRRDHADTFFDHDLNAHIEIVLNEIDERKISTFSWSVSEYIYISKAIRSATNAIPYYSGEKNIKALTTFHNPELLILKTIFNTKIDCYAHGIRLKNNNFKRKFPLEAGCDVLYIMYKEDTDGLIKQFDKYKFNKPKIVHQKTFDIEQVECCSRKRIVYLQTIYKNISPALEIIKLRINHRHIYYKLHPRLSSNIIKKIFYDSLNLALGGRVDEPTYRKDTLYLSNGSTALLNAMKQKCEVAFYSPSRSVKNPYPDYMKIRDYEN